MKLLTVALLLAAVSLTAFAERAPISFPDGLPWRSEREIARLRIVNDSGGEITVSTDGGATWRTVGHVVRYTTRVNTNGYTASKWVPPGHVAATAVNAIHINVGLNRADDRGIVFSLLPREFLASPQVYRSFLSPDSSIYTDISAGHGIFGGGIAPFVGNPVYLLRPPDRSLTPVTEGYRPAQGDTLAIVILKPDPYPVSIDFENHSGGTVCMVYPDGRRKQLGWVVRPVRGVGRFEGGLYTGIGRIRANHAGVIDVKASPVGYLGGFQIIPFGHSISPEMNLAWERAQWMVVGPVGAVGNAPSSSDEPLWEGLMPLFYQYIRPDYLPSDLYAPDWEDRLLARFLVDVQTTDSWRPMPVRELAPSATAPLPGWADEALGEVTKVRILFPLEPSSLSASG